MPTAARPTARPTPRPTPTPSAIRRGTETGSPPSTRASSTSSRACIPSGPGPGFRAVAVLLTISGLLQRTTPRLVTLGGGRGGRPVGLIVLLFQTRFDGRRGVRGGRR